MIRGRCCILPEGPEIRLKLALYLDLICIDRPNDTEITTKYTFLTFSSNLGKDLFSDSEAVETP